jgi:integrase
MGKRSQTGGITAVGTRRIRFDFFFEGQRYRPSIMRAPTDLNLRRAREQLAGIKERIAIGTFAFADEFPNFRDLKSVADSGSRRTCGHVFDAFLAHCESRMAKDDMAPITVSSYRRVLNTFWRPKIGAMPFLAVRYSMLVRIADEALWSKKTYNNAISVLRRAIKFEYHDHPDRHDPTLALKSARIRKERPRDHRTFHHPGRRGNHLSHPSGLGRGSRKLRRVQILHWTATVRAGRPPRVGFRPDARHPDEQQSTRGGIDKDSTKTGEDRRIELCPRALQVLNRQLALRQRLVEAGKIDHEHLFLKETGEPIRNLQYAHFRWRRTLERLPGIRYRKPYCARHSSVSWSLMIGRSALWVAKQHGHSIATMLRVYAAWTEGAIEADLDAIKRAMAAAPPRIIRPPTELAPAATNASSTSNTARPVPRRERDRLPSSDMALDLSLARRRRHVNARPKRNYLAEREGFEPSKGF